MTKEYGKGYFIVRAERRTDYLVKADNIEQVRKMTERGLTNKDILDEKDIGITYPENMIIELGGNKDGTGYLWISEK